MGRWILAECKGRMTSQRQRSYHFHPQYFWGGKSSQKDGIWTWWRCWRLNEWLCDPCLARIWVVLLSRIFLREGYGYQLQTTTSSPDSQDRAMGVWLRKTCDFEKKQLLSRAFPPGSSEIPPKLSHTHTPPLLPFSFRFASRRKREDRNRSPGERT